MKCSRVWIFPLVCFLGSGKAVLKQMCNLQIMGKQGNTNNWGKRVEEEVEPEGRGRIWSGGGGVCWGRAGWKGDGVSLKGWLHSAVMLESPCDSTWGEQGQLGQRFPQCGGWCNEFQLKLKKHLKSGWETQCGELFCAKIINSERN